MGMAFASNHGVDLCYETYGDRADPALLLVMGLGAQLTAWPMTFVDAFVAAKHFVIRFDNRDAGLSTKFDGVRVDMPAIMAAWSGDGTMPEVPYTLSDMAADAFAVLDDLGIECAHIVGASLGGMIVQTMAIEHPARVLSLTSIMSTTGEPDYYKSDPAVRAAMLKARPAERSAYIDATVDYVKTMSSRRYFDADDVAARTGVAYDRSFYPVGLLRQTAAVRASGSREVGLATLKMPTLVIHGTDDTLILPLAGERTAAVIPGAHFLLAADMGHDLPIPLQPFLSSVIVGFVCGVAASPSA